MEYQDNLTAEIDKEELELVNEYAKNGKLHKKYLPFATYDMVQTGYPYVNHGEMIPRLHGGTNEKGELLPSTGKWVRIEDIKAFLKKKGIKL